MTIQEATFTLVNKLQNIYSESESWFIADWVIEFVTGSTKSERMLYKNEQINSEEKKHLLLITGRLMKNEPVQYVLNEAWFFGLKFFVDKNVLIPRPETEELVDWVISNSKPEIESKIILDIGTGSGCIPITLKSKTPKAKVWACDMSTAALDVATKNAVHFDTEINFLHLDFLEREAWSQLPQFNIITSNPPYVPEKDKATMNENVLNFEPAAALFVPDNNPLIFYEAISDFGKTHLLKGGAIYFEIHEDLGKSTMELLSGKGYAAELKKDMQGKDRMIMASLVN